MVCWHRRYNRGEKHDYSDPSEFLQRMVRSQYSEKELIRAIKKGKTNITLVYNRSGRAWDATTPAFWSTLFGNSDPSIYTIGSYTPAELETSWVYEDMLENLTIQSMHDLLDEADGYAMLPLYLYDHSGITMNTTGFNDRWDSGQVGFIYTTKDRVTELMGEKNVTKDWKTRASEIMNQTTGAKTQKKILNDISHGKVRVLTAYSVRKERK